MAELWNAWTISMADQASFTVKGIQHFSLQHSKNSADIAIALDAATDFLKQKVHYVAVLSDDSDFISLFAKIREEHTTSGNPKGRVPFLWIVTDRDKTKTPNLERFFPGECVHVAQSLVEDSKLSKLDVDNSLQNSPANKPDRTGTITDEIESVARAIISETELGPFKSTDCKAIVKRVIPNSTLGSLPDNQFGKQFLDNIWPKLELYGVEWLGTKPVKYEMTQIAKDYLRKV